MEFQPFSVATSVYKNDNPIFFSHALESITDKQTIKPDEVVLVVDGPVPDEIDSVVEEFSSRYNFKVIRLDENEGLGNALRIAVENCSNDLVARMDSDDIASENRFELQLNFLNKNPYVSIVGGVISEFIGEESNIVGYRVVPSTNEQIKAFLKKRCPFNHMTVMFRKKDVIEVGNYQDWFYNEDYFLWIRLAIANKQFANIPEVLVNVRTGKDLYKRRGGWKYFKSEKEIQHYMRVNRVISFPRYSINVLKRFLIQVVSPSWFRGIAFRLLARKQKRLL